MRKVEEPITKNCIKQCIDISCRCYLQFHHDIVMMDVCVCEKHYRVY